MRPAGLSTGADKLAKLAVVFENVLTGDLKPHRELARPPAFPSRTRVFTVAPRVLVDNKASASHTVIEVNGRDRPGLLFELTRALTGLNLQVSSAKISTYGEKVVDVFYVKDLFGHKVEHPTKLADIRRTLEAVLARETSPFPPAWSRQPLNDAPFSEEASSFTALRAREDGKQLAPGSPERIWVIHGPGIARHSVLSLLRGLADDDLALHPPGLPQHDPARIIRNAGALARCPGGAGHPEFPAWRAGRRRWPSSTISCGPYAAACRALPGGGPKIRPCRHRRRHYFVAGSGEAALRAAGAVGAAVDAVVGGEADNAFCAVRPPGHHAEPDRAMGFCLFNNAAVGALRAREVHGLARVAVIDFDVHHGNGTQAVFESDGEPFLRLDPPIAALSRHRCGRETGVGNIVNVPLRADGRAPPVPPRR